MKLINDFSVTAWKRPVLASYLPPNGTPTPQLVLDFSRSLYAVAGRIVDLPITLTRASTATYFDSSGVLKTAAADAPRFDHDPVTGEARGLLIEESRTNMVMLSENFSAWATDDVTVTSDAETAPDGALSADNIVEAATTAQHRVKQVVYVTAGTRYTVSVFARSPNRGVRILAWTSDWSATTTADLQAGTVTAASGSAAVGSEITPLDGEWYRVSLTFDAAATDIMQVMFYLDDYSGSNTYAGDSTFHVTLWGAQMEEGGAASSYISTADSPVTRAGDNAVVSDVAWLTQGQGTLLVEAGWNNISDLSFNAYAVALRQDVPNFLGIRAASFTSGNTQTASTVDGTNQAPLILGGGGHQGTIRKMAFAYAPDDFAFTIGGAAPATDSAGAVPEGITELHVGQLLAAAGQINGHVRKLIYYSTRLPDAQIQEITA